MMGVRLNAAGTADVESGVWPPLTATSAPTTPGASVGVGVRVGERVGVAENNGPAVDNGTC
jgi:hypothetical protein